MGNIISSGSISLTDLNDATITNTSPSNPKEGMIWLDTSGQPPYRFYIYRNGSWQPTDFESLQDMDPDSWQKVEDAYNGVTSLDDDGKVTRYERSVIRGEIGVITGVYLASTAAMPTLDQVDANGTGDLYAIRKRSRDLGLPTTDATYVRLGTAYDSLRTYLSGLSPKAWDTTSTSVTTVVSATWDAKWKEYYLAYQLLSVVNNQRAQNNAESLSAEAVKNALSAINNPDMFSTETLGNPTVINSGITSVAFPFFEGRHVDTWNLNGKNLVVESAKGWSSSEYKVMGGNLTENWVAGETYTITLKGTINDGQKFGLWADASTHQTYLTYNNELGLYTATFKGVLPQSTDYYKTISLYNYPGETATAATIEWIKIEKGSKFKEFSQAPTETWASNGNRIKPVTNPVFTSNTSLTVNVKLYGDGTNNDSLQWDTNGNVLRVKKWEDISLDSSLNWEYSWAYTGCKQLKVTGFSSSGIVDLSATAVKYDGSLLETLGSGMSKGDQIIVRQSDNTMLISVPNTDSGWAESYTPTTDEIKAYFNGWRMCNNTVGGLYASGTKYWYPIGDTSLSRVTTEIPKAESPSIRDNTINYYQVVYRMIDPVQESVDFNGIINLVTGANSIAISYPSNTPEITTGYYMYATNLATVTEAVKVLIPTIQRRLANAEQVITDESIVGTVINSVEYQIALDSKASAEDLGNYATQDALKELDEDVGNRIGNALDTIDFSPYVTQSQLEQKATNITAKFSATGGMNVIKNSVGFAGLSYWQDYSSSKIATISTNELDTLGFGSGFLFNPDGNNKGIQQTINVIPGQPYTLSWYLNKRTQGADQTYRFFIQIMEDGVITQQLADNSNKSTIGYESEYMNFTPKSATVTVRFIAYGNVDATLTGLMMNIGDIALQWSLATGELYNTHVRMDINGIRVSQIDANRKEVGFTQITPEEFAGYSDASGSGTFEKIFYLNGDETVTKKLRAIDEITMGNVKIISVTTGEHTGWAFVPNIN